MLTIPNLLNFVPKPTKSQKAQYFWQWFEKEKNAYLFLNEVEESERERLVDLFSVELDKYNKHVSFEIGGHPKDETLELVIHANGIKKYFKAVEFLVHAAPCIKNWKIIAFKPPMGTRFTTRYGGYEFDPNKIIFIPLYSKKAPNAVGIQVCYPDFTEAQKRLFLTGTYLMLDVILGEKSTALDIDYVEVVQTPADIGTFNFQHLCEIQAYISERKGLDLPEVFE